MLPTSQAEALVDAVDHAEAQAAGAGRAISDTAAVLDVVVRRLSGFSGGSAAAGAGGAVPARGWPDEFAGAGAVGAGAWSGFAGEQARQRVGDLWTETSVLSGHCLFLADVLRVEGSWLARALLAGGSEFEVEDADRLLAKRLAEAADALAGFTAHDVSTVPCLDLTASTDGDPRAVAKLWHSLDPAQRQRLARDYPELGSVAGLSSATRDALNRTRLARLLDAGGGPGGPGGFGGRGGSSGRGQGGLGVSGPKRQRLLALAEHLDADPQRLLLSLDVDGPGNEGPRAVVASADPDGADRVVTLIPGTGSSLESLDRTSARADALCEAAGAADLGGVTDTAGLDGGADAAGLAGDADGLGGGADPSTGSCVAVSWQGYDAPPDVPTAGASTNRAFEHADDLQTYAAGLDAVETMDGHDAPHTAVGYSYGSTALGAAASDPRGLAVDRMVHVGSPGAAVESIADQWIDDSTRNDGTGEDSEGAAGKIGRPAKDDEVVSVASRWDPVPWWSISGVLGERPGTEAFGGAAVDVTEPGDGPSSIRDTHSRYFDPGTVSLSEIGKILFPRKLSGL